MMVCAVLLLAGGAAVEFGCTGGESRRSLGGAPPAVGSLKKGVGTWHFDGVGQALADIRVSWYYTWSSSRADVVGPATAEFVPMIWGAQHVNAEALAEAEGQVLLGFNEPDRADQANLSVRQALDLWPQLMATGLRLGSPAPAADAAEPGSWLDAFLRGAAARHYRVDFIALHWYGADFVTDRAVSQLAGYLQATYDRYRLPIWLTEYALVDFSAGVPRYPTQERQAAFVAASTLMLERLSYVERYAWFALPSDGIHGATGLYFNGTATTAVGAAYRTAPRR
jgi:Glycosyl hydrolase catalytic core